MQRVSVFPHEHWHSLYRETHNPQLSTHLLLYDRTQLRRLLSEVLAALHAAHATGRVAEGVNVDAFVNPIPASRSASANAKVNMTLDAEAAKIFDHMQTKAWATRLAFDAAITTLRVDQIIMARPAGGPAPSECFLPKAALPGFSQPYWVD